MTLCAYARRHIYVFGAIMYMCMCFCSANFCLALTAVSLGENIVSGISICTHNAVNFACFIMQVMY